MSAVVELQGVHKSFGVTEVIRGVDLAIERGELHAIIGPNGAGKSTLFNLLTGLYRVTQGRILLHGKETTNLEPYEIYRRGLSRSFQVSNIFSRLSVYENLRCGVLWSLGYKYSFWQFVDKQRDLNLAAEALLERTGLRSVRDVPAGLLSYSDQRALEIGIAIAGAAEVILLDEPTAGMSHSETERAVNLIRDIREDRTLIIVEHDMGVVFDLADRISVLVYGEVLASDSPGSIRADRSVQEAYLGKD